MKKPTFAESHIAGVLKQGDTGATVENLCCEQRIHCVT